MRNFDKIKKKLKELEPFLKERFGVKRIGIFGSYVKQKQRKESDLDILVEFSETPDLFEFIELENFLRKLLKIKVDLATKEALKPLIKKEILRETIYI